MRRGPVAWLLMVAMLIMLVPVPAQAEPPLFWDTMGTDYQAPVNRLHDLGVVAGNPDGTFGPSNGVTRAQMAALAMRALKDQAKPDGTAHFSDVPATHWAVSVVERAAEIGLIRGDGTGRFRPDDPVTYGEAMVILIRMLGYEQDVEGAWPAGPILKARELGLIKPGQSFVFSDPMTRGALALALDAAVFEVVVRGTEHTLSQSVHRHVVQAAITPDTDVLGSGAVQLEAHGLDAVGKPIDVAQVSWRLLSGQATLSESGMLSNQTGKVRVQAAVGEFTVEREYRQIASLHIEGMSALLQPSTTVVLKATAKDTEGAEVTVPVTWSVTGGQGAITADGQLTPTASGDIEVTVAFAGLKATAKGVVGGALAIAPLSGPLAPGESVMLKATAGGVPLSNVTWTVISGDGRVEANGQFTAGKTAAAVSARVGEQSTQLVIDVLTQLQLSSANLYLSKAEVTTVTAKAVTATGQQVSVTPAWSMTGGVGIVDASGRLIATASGQGTLSASYHDLTASIPVVVTGDPARVAITAEKSSIVANGHSQTTLTARVTDTAGNTVKTAQGKAIFTLAGAMGSLSASEAVFVNGEGSVTYTAGTQVGTVQVTVGTQGLALPGSWINLALTAPAVSKAALSVSPKVMAAQAGARSTVTLTLLDQDGYAVANPTVNYITMSLSASGPATLGVSQLSIFPGQSSATTYAQSNGTPGDIAITGSGSMAVAATTLRTVITGPAAKLAIRPVTAVKADNLTDAVIEVEVQDANGAVRTQDGGSVVTLSGQMGDYVLTALPQQALIQNGVATFKVRSSKAGDLQLTARASGLQAAEGKATFLPGDAYRVRLTVDPADPSSSQVAFVAADAGATTVTLKAEIVDLYDNVVPNAVNTVTFSREVNNKATVLPTALGVIPTNGVATLQLPTTSNIGSDTFRAAANGLQSSSNVTVTTRITGVPVKLQIMPVATSPVNTEATVKVRLLDWQGYQVTGATGVVATLTSTSPTFSSNGPQPIVLGAATFKVKDTQSGTWSLTAKATGVNDASLPVSWVVTPGQAVRVRLTATPEAVPGDGSVPAVITAEVLDAFGNTVASSNTITLTVEGGTLTNSTLMPGGIVMLRPIAANASATVSGTVSSGIMVDPVTVRAYTPTAPARVIVEVPTATKVGTQMTVRVKVLDTNGNIATQALTNSQFSQAGLSLEGLGGTNTSTITNAGGAGLTTFSFVPDGVHRGAAVISYGVATFVYTNTRAESVTFTPLVYYNGQLLPATPSTIVTQPGTAANLIVDGLGNAIQADGQSTGMLTARVTDAYGNTVAIEGDSFQLSLDKLDYLTLSGLSAVQTNTGLANFTLVAKSGNGGRTGIRVASQKTGLITTGQVVTDQMPAQPTAWAYSAVGGSTTITAASGGAYIQVIAQARTSIQTVYVYVNGVRVNVYSSLVGGTVVDSIASGNVLLTGYIRYADFGGTGVKDVRVVLTSPLGTGPFSPGINLNVTN